MEAKRRQVLDAIGGLVTFGAVLATLLEWPQALLVALLRALGAS